MFGKLQILFLVVFTLIVLADEALAQKRDGVKPPPESASLGEAKEWIVDAMPKHASYKTRVTTATTSEVKFEGCTLNFALARRSGSTSTDTMGATRTTRTAKENIRIDLSTVAPNGISVVDHIYPELQTLELLSGRDESARVTEIVVKREAGEAIQTTLLHIARLCTPKN